MGFSDVLVGERGGVTPSMCTELQESWKYCKGLSIPLVIVFSVTYSLVIVVRQMVERSLSNGTRLYTSLMGDHPLYTRVNLSAITAVSHL